MADFREILSTISVASSTTASPQSVANSTVARSLTSISAVLSMLGTLVIIVTYIAWKDIRSCSRKILVYISIADFLTAFGNMMSSLWYQRDKTDTPCKIQSFITTSSSLMSFFWTTFLALFLYVTIAKRRPKAAERMMIAFHLLAWGVPLGITVTAAVYPITIGNSSYAGVLGNSKDTSSAGWCWIRFGLEPREELKWMLLTGKAWEILAYFLIMFLYLALKCHIYREVHYKRQQFITASSLEAAIKADKKLTFVPILFILLRIWGTIRFLIFVTGSKEEAWLVYLHGIGDSAQGFANFMLFCFFTQKFQNKIKKTFSKCCACLKINPSPRQDTSSYAVYSQQKGGHNVNERKANENSPLLASMEHHPPNIIKDE